MSKQASPEPVIIPRPEHTLSRKNIDPDALKVMYRLSRNGFKAYLVGGSVRDILLGKTPKDFDVSTDARPGEIRKIFRNCRIIGRRFRLAHIYFRGNKIIEVSTFRKTPAESSVDESDDASPARRGDNTFGEPHEDAQRRDLTINGLFYDIDSFSILDYVGGIQDLRDGIARAIGNPDDRFREDPLRMIRTVRHAVQAGFRIEENTYSSLVQCAPLLGDCNVSRIQDDVQKDFHRGHFASVLDLQMETGLLKSYFPELDGYLRGTGDVQRLFGPAWLRSALRQVDARPAQDECTRKFRLASLVLPLLESRILEHMPSVLEPGLPGKEVHESLMACCAPIGIFRRDRETVKMLWSSWIRLQKHLAAGRIPIRFQKKPYFSELCDWHVFYHVVGNSSEKSVRQEIRAAKEGTQPAAKRKRRRRKKKQPTKPPDFS